MRIALELGPHVVWRNIQRPREDVPLRMEALVVCTRCRHGIALHGDRGCTTRACACRATDELILSEELAALRRDDVLPAATKEWWK